MPPCRGRPMEFRHLLSLLVSGVVALAALGLAAAVRHEHDEILARATRDASAAARLMEEHTRRTIDAADLLLAAVNRMPGAETPDEVAANPARLTGLAARLPMAGAVVVADASGRAVEVTADGRVRWTEVGWRPYFQALRQSPGPGGPEIGTMERSRRDGRPFFTVSRARTGAEGAFAGTLSVSVLADDDFRQVLRTLGPRAALAVARRDGAYVLRQPAPETALGRVMPSPPSFPDAAIDHTEIVRRASALDGVERIYAYRTIPDQGLVAVAGLSVADALAPWRKWAALATLLFATMAVAVGALTILACRGLRREQDLLRGLGEEVRLRTEEARRQADVARRAETAKNHFLATASHDLRQPLQAMEMFAEVLSGQLTTPQQLRAFDPLRQALGSANQLLGTLLEVSALEAGAVEPSIRTFALSEVFAALEPQIAPLAADKGLTFHIVGTSAVVSTDPTMLERMIRNLLVNAVRYTAAGGIVLGCRRRGKAVAIQVVDTGIGIAADKLSVVFEDFARLDSGNGEGRGLGLGIVRRQADLLGLDLAVQSVPGSGSIFSITVPLAQSQQHALCIGAVPL